MWGCWHELIYAGTGYFAGIFFCILISIAFSLGGKTKVIKYACLGTFAMIFIGLGFLIAELSIDTFNYSSCDEKEGTAIFAMLCAAVLMIALSISVRNQRHVINNLMDTIFGCIFGVLFLTYAYFEFWL